MWLLTADESDCGSRLDVVLSKRGTLSRNAVQRLIIENRVTVDGRIARKNDRVKSGESISIDLPEPVQSEAEAEEIPLDIIYEDADLLVINKSAGMVVHPAPGHEGGTLVNALLHHCGEGLSGIGGVKRPGIVHRLDKDTSGLLVAAKNDFTHTALSAALKRREISRIYMCVVRGNPGKDTFTVSAPMGRHPVNRKKQAVLPDGRPAVTHVEVLSRSSGYSLLRCALETGRTHQIRVHLAHVGLAVTGDPLYNPNPGKICGQLLHACELGFTHPRTGEYMRFTARPPEHFAAFAKSKGLL